MERRTPLPLEPDGTPTDPYKVAASKIFNVPYDQVTPGQRSAAKRATYWGRYAPTYLGDCPPFKGKP